MIVQQERGFYLECPFETDMGDRWRFSDELPLYLNIFRFQKDICLKNSEVEFLAHLNPIDFTIMNQIAGEYTYKTIGESKVELMTTNLRGNPQPYERRICNDTANVKTFEKNTLYFFPRLLSGNGGYEGYDIKAIVKYMFDRRRRD